MRPELDRWEIYDWCERKQKNVVHERALRKAALHPRYSKAEEVRKEVLEAYKNRPQQLAARRLAERLGPLLDGHRGLRINLSTAYKVRSLVLDQASAKFGLPKATVDKAWKLCRAKIRAGEALLAEARADEEKSKL